MEFTRRQSLQLGLGALAAFSIPFKALASVPVVGSPEEFTGGASVGSEGIVLDAPEIAENGNTVPLEVSAPGAVEIRVYAMGNPLPGVATFTFGPLAASQTALSFAHGSAKQRLQMHFFPSEETSPSLQRGKVLSLRGFLPTAAQSHRPCPQSQYQDWAEQS